MEDQALKESLINRWQSFVGKKVKERLFYLLQKEYSPDDEPVWYGLGNEFSDPDKNPLNADLRGITLNDTVFDRKPYLGLALDYAKLNNCEFHHIMTNSHYRHAELNQCKFSAQEMHGLDFQYAKLSSCEFAESGMINASNLTNATLENCEFRNTRVTNTFSENTTFSKTKFINVTFNITFGKYTHNRPLLPEETAYLNFADCFFEKTEIYLMGKWRYLRFDGSDLRGLVFSEWNRDFTAFENASFVSVKATEVSFSKLTFNNADFTNAILDGADFSNCNLRGANFRGASLKNTKLDAADLEGAIFD